MNYWNNNFFASFWWESDYFDAQGAEPGTAADSPAWTVVVQGDRTWSVVLPASAAWSVDLAPTLSWRIDVQ